jgi:3-oxoacyl-[acyl-carrier protein] reductase
MTQEQTRKPVALVTGSSRGIGLGIARVLANQGFNLIIHGRSDSSALENAQAELEARGCSVFRIAFDIANVAEHSAMLEKAWSHFGRIDCLVNNAGVSVHSRGDILDVSLASFDEQISVNLRGAFFFTQGVARRMIAHESHSFRSVVFISSSNAVSASVDRAEYCIAKAGLSMLVKLLALRLAEKGINVYEVRPGLIETDMTLAVKDRYDKRLESGFSPINRWGTTAEVGSLVGMLASGEIPFTTGEIINVDGGLTISRY